MKKEKIVEKYEANMHLYSLLDILSSLQENGRKYWYPDDINKAIDDLLKKIDNHIYHGHEDYDIADEKITSEITFEKIIKD